MAMRIMRPILSKKSAVAPRVRQGSATERFVLAAAAVRLVLSIFSEAYLVSAVGIEPTTL
jgi:hypothetical protein